MYPVSEAFKAAIAKPHRMVAKAEIVDGDGAILATLAITSGNITIDKTSENRRRCTLEVVPIDVTPDTAEDLLHPLSGNLLRPYRGIWLDTGEEYVSLGVFGLEDALVTDSGESVSLTITAFDQSKIIERNQFLELYFVAEGTNYSTAIKDLIDDRLPGLTYNFMTTSRTTPPMVFGYGGNNTNPWKSAQAMAVAIGAELYFDGDGVCVLRPEPDPTTDPVAWTYAENAQAMILHAERKMTREGVANRVIGFGLNTATDEVIRVEAVDDDPQSPTYYLGPFGNVPVYYRSTMLLTEAQAQEAVDAQLRKLLGTPEQIRLVNVVNPAHDVGDIVKVSNNATRLTERRFIIDKVNIPLQYDNVMNLECRETQG